MVRLRHRAAVAPLIRADERERLAGRAKELWKRQDTFGCSNPKACNCDDECVEAVEALASAIRGQSNG
jgi:hypothetical protein